MKRSKEIASKELSPSAESQPAVKPEKPVRVLFQEYSEAFVIAVILAIIIRAFLVQAFKIPSSSMEPTLLIGDHILVNKFIYGVRIPFTDARWPRFTNPARGDVIVFVYPVERNKDFIKRVVAVEGDTIEIRDKKVFVNDKPVDEPYAHHFANSIEPRSQGPRDNLPPVTVPPGAVFAMGDNRDFSHDSRYWGFVPVEDIKGKAFIIYYSAQYLPDIRWERFFRLIR
ncbi:MAG: signal peptidase I [Desulfomonile sp.]|nr:signal peptidase I [Desulfomonile sp.]